MTCAFWKVRIPLCILSQNLPFSLSPYSKSLRFMCLILSNYNCFLALDEGTTGWQYDLMSSNTGRGEKSRNQARLRSEATVAVAGLSSASFPSANAQNSSSTANLREKDPRDLSWMTAMLPYEEARISAKPQINQEVWGYTCQNILYPDPNSFLPI